MISMVASSSTLAALQCSRSRPMRSASTSKRPSARNSQHRLGHRRAVAAPQLEQQPLEVARHLDVHARAQRRVAPRPSPSTADSRNRVRMSLALLATTNCDDRQAHPLGAVAGEHVAEVAGGHGEADRRPPAGQASGRGHVVDDLGHHPGPVDRVDRRQVAPAGGTARRRTAPSPGPGSRRRCPRPRGCGRSATSTVVIWRRWTSDTRPAGCRITMSMAGAVAARLDGRRARVARRGADDRDPLAARGRARGRTAGPTSWSATSLKASVGPWNSSASHRPAPRSRSGHDLGIVERGVGVDDDRPRTRRARSIPRRTAT